MLDRRELEYAIVEGIPLHRTLGLRVVHEPEPPGVLLPHRSDLANHLGDTAGAAVFAVAEAASAAMVFWAYSDLCETHFAIPARLQLVFRRPAVGDLLARAGPGPPAGELAAQIALSGEARLPVAVTVEGADRRVALELNVEWRFRASRPGGPPSLPRRAG